MTSREIITIQFGHYSNFIGTHWWNIQECNFSYDHDNPSEIDHDVLYREGENQKKQVTFTPRALIVDLDNACGHLSKAGTLYNVSDNLEGNVLWDKKKTEFSSTTATPKTPFIESLDKTGSIDAAVFDFENIIKTWADYLVPRYHPRTLNIVNAYKHNCTVNPFNVFTYGQNLWKTRQFSEDFEDRIRAYVEETDFLQGFQILVDSTDGFAGLGAMCTQHIYDEYGKSILAFPCMDSDNIEPAPLNVIKTINTALCWQHIGEHSSLYSPLSCGEKGWPTAGDPRKFDRLTYDLQCKYHTSAILATALDTFSLRYRRKEYRNVALSDLCTDLNKLGRKAAATSLSLPFPMIDNMDLIDVLDNLDGPLWTSMTPNCNIPTDKNMQSIALRGISEDRLKRPLQNAQKQMSMPAYKCSSVHEMMTLYLACTCYASATYFTNIVEPLKITNPYPKKIFKNDLTERGNIAGGPVGADVQSVPVMAGLHSGSSLSNMFESLHDQVCKVKDIKKHHVFTDAGLEQDEFRECIDHLLDCKEAYEDHYV